MNSSTVTGPPTASNRGFLLGVIALVAVGLALVAVVATRGGSDDDIPLNDEQTAAVSVDGDALAQLPADVRVGTEATDPEFGKTAPTIELTDFADDPVVIEPDGRPKVIYFLAHWCPHCQDEVPVIQELLDSGAKPDGLDIYAVSTAVDAGQGNYPPQSWLAREGFEPLALRDDASGTAFAAFGGGGFPYAVYLDADHTVVARSAGSVEPELITDLWELAATN